MGKQSIKWDLFRRAVNNQLRDGERIDFEKWLQDDPENRKYFNKALSFHAGQSGNRQQDEHVLSEAWADFSKNARKGKRKIFFSRLQKVAALALILVSLYFTVTQFRKYRDITLAYRQGQDIVPGRSIAMLTLDNGREIVLENTDTIIGLEQSLEYLTINSGKIEYGDHDTSLLKRPVLNRIYIPHGGEYRVTLPDGSQMWVNSETLVEYYVPFRGNNREVYVSGEICLEVVKDSLRPFRVRTDDYNVQVLGTTFNVSAYPDDDFTTTTLARGRVEITGDGLGSNKHILLEPDQQLVFDKTSSGTEVKDVDASVYTAWTRGFFVFEDETLYSIFRKLERWYDIQVFFFSEEAENEYFTGKLPRFDNLEDILDLINKVSLSKLELKGTTVTIK